MQYKITLSEIKVSRTYRWKDADGKKRQRTKFFMQTPNPYNRHKTREEILVAVNAEADAWLKECTEKGLPI